MIKSWIARLYGQTLDVVPLSPAMRFYAIGDIHGRFDLLTRLLEQLDPAYPVICVGDYIDRGEASAKVLSYLSARPEIRCLMGNHEDMLLDFLDTPERSGSRWLRNGGLQTLASFGVSGVTETSEGDDLTQARDSLNAAMGVDLIAWIRRLPRSHQSGNVFICHAGADPKASLEDQQDQHLLWGHPEFSKTTRRDGNWVLHGHTIVDKAVAQNTRISIDTGAFATGHLTAALIQPGEVLFIST
ncbi:serine/threonine protein phosphatase [Parasedimentitalea marina]|uniref:Serine/threonine protein phosphatase n=1 Tax=Parasedimentitalea marina TaxID=2483033 RepID=A0A3T0N5M0_9RHOB|nr:metallophosphoesterase [Parasedimentitalea marina]AZV79333.1 serine/threonine protein phosphatase [Parasedimentitalea marina]